jgi:hypothetical protein
MTGHGPPCYVTGVRNRAKADDVPVLAAVLLWELFCEDDDTKPDPPAADASGRRRTPPPPPPPKRG